MDQNTDTTNQNMTDQNTDQNDQQGVVEPTPVVEKTPEEKPVEETAPEETKSDATIENEEEDEETTIIINKEVPETAHWYVVHTYSGHESKVAITLKERVIASGHSDKVFKIFVPHQEKIVVSEGKKRSVDEKLFPGYIIILMTMNDESWYIVRSTPGVTGFVGMGSEPTPLPESEVRTLMKFAKMETPKFEAKFRVGDAVKVNDGPFKEFFGKIDEVNEEQGKVRVLVNVFTRETSLELDFSQVSQL
jgi:transcriptional antiterminator NusG